MDEVRGHEETAVELVTLFVAVAFERDAEGELRAGAPARFPSAGAARGEARRMAKTAAGALAFSRTGDPASGDFQDAVVLLTSGEVPNLDGILRSGEDRPI